jgi:hypothetical protein
MGEPLREATADQVMIAVAGLPADGARWWSRPDPRDPGESFSGEAGDLLSLDAEATGDGVFQVDDGPGTSTTSLVLKALDAGRG